MRYYVTADVHGYFSLLKAALTRQGFFDDPQPHKLIICGDLYDRGAEAKELQDFILELMAQNRIILIRGNHEDLTQSLLHSWHRRSYLQSHHNLNGTVDTLCQLTGISLRQLYDNPEHMARAFLKNPFMQTILPATVDYYETDRYIFVHGWIPCTPVSVASHQTEYIPMADWRNADKSDWDKARWINGMEAAHAGITEPGKTIVCGHWHCSFGHEQYEQAPQPDFTPYYGNGIIALDACTPVSQTVNCIVIED